MKRLFKFLSVFLTIALMFSCVQLMPNIKASAASSGTCGANLTWTLDDEGTLTISGTGKMYSWNYPCEVFAPWYNSSVKTVIINDGVTSIGNDAFYVCDALTNITIPDSVTSIGETAFYQCTALTSITIPDSVTSIGEDAFGNCWALTSITIPGSVTTIERYAFSSCKALTDVTIQNGVTSIDFRAFSYCTALTNITIPASVTLIGYRVFIGCNNLESIVVDDGNPVYHSDGNCLIKTESKTLVKACKNSVIPSDGSVTSIGDSAFYECSNLTSITIPDSVTKIEYYAFGYCENLTSLTIPDSVTSIGISAFYKCSSLTSIVIPDSVTSIGNSAFNGCTALTSITIPDGVTSIGSSTFQSCYKLTSINIPDGVTSIGNSAFRYCSSLTSINIPDGVTSIGDHAFYECSNLTSINIPDGVTNMGDWAFGYCSSLTSMTIGVTNIKYSAFYGCSSLTNITILDSVTSIEQGAFRSCPKRESIVVGDGNTVYHSDGNCLIETESKTLIQGCKNSVIPSDGSVTSIGKYAFYDCRLTSMTIPDSVTSIGDHAFRSCTGLTSITIPGSVNSIGDYAFGYCSELTSITIPNGVTSIGYRTFEYCSELTSITIPDGVTSIGSYAFYGCTNLINITIPDSVTSIGGSAFRNCTRLKSITIPDGVTSIEDYVFFGCTNLINITIPDSVTSIKKYAFYKCSNLTNLTIPDSVTSIGHFAFWGRTGLTSITIPDSVTSIGDGVFGGYSNLESIVVEDGNTVYHSDGNCLIETESKTLIQGYKNSVIPSDGSVTCIGSYAFYRCTTLTSITISGSVNYIKYNAFYGCDNLTDVYYAGTEEQWKTVTVDSGNKSLTNATIHFCTSVEDDATGIIIEGMIDGLNAEIAENNDQAQIALIDGNVLKLYDITLAKDGETVQPESTVTVKIPIPENVDSSLARVYRVETDGTLTDMNAKIVDGYFVFTTEHFSLYAVVDPLTRLSGSSRYDTAVAISNQGWESADTVILANGTNYADALAGVPLAYKLNAPILLTENWGDIESNVAAQIENLSASKVIILGGYKVISQQIEDTLSEKYTVERIKGATRYDTAVEISKIVSENPETAIVVTGTGYADALSISPYAAMKGYPIVYTDPATGLTDSTVDYLSSAKDIIIIGGYKVVRENTVAQLEGKTIDRIYGSSRYLTSYEIANRFSSEFGNDVMLATGTSFPDALAGGVLAAKLKTPLLLTEKPAVIDEIKNFILDKSPSNIYVLGGEKAMPTSIVENIYA